MIDTTSKQSAPPLQHFGRLAGFGATLHRLSPLIALALFIGALWLLHHELARYHLGDLEQALAELSPTRVAAAVLFTFSSYVALTGYDALAVRYIGRRLPFRRIAFAAFEGFAFSQNFALSGVTGASVRYRLYTGWGLSAAEVAALVVFNGLSFWLGFLTCGGIALIVEPTVPPVLHLHRLTLRVLGTIFLAFVLVFLAINTVRQRPWKIARWRFHSPPLRLAIGQIVVATLDWSLVAGALYVLLPPGTISYPAFLGAFIFAQIIGLISHVPGGLGVFETVLVTSLASRTSVGPLLTALIVFRVVYYLIPLFTAATLLAGNELLRRKPVTAPLAASRLSSLVPPVLAMAVFLAGVVLLVSGATPAEPGRLHQLGRLVPLPFVELSHFMGSVAGALLLLLARGVQRRQRGSFFVAVTLMGAGIAFSLLKGFDYEEAVFLALVIGVLISCRHVFYRKASLLDERFTTPWAVSIVIVLAGTAWLALFAHKHTQYSADLFWQFALDAHAPRALRAEVGAMLVIVVAAGKRLIRPPKLPGGAVPGELNRVRAIVAGEKNTTASLALLGDKQFLFSASGDCALMYGVRGRTWVAFGDPIGSEDEKRELIWAFRELADRNGSWVAFYEVASGYSAIYRDLGLGMFNLGEEARVRLDQFSLQGGGRKSLRTAHNHALREGLAFDIVSREAVSALLPELRLISADWLAGKGTSEKGFSLGFFDEDYLRNFPIAIVRKERKVLAFANVLQGTGKHELSIDLMRHRMDVPHGVMDYLFVELMLWGKEAGYQWFNLGMAPLSGLTSGPLAPLWDRAGAFLFRHGEHFYNFEGLRNYKAKFDPVWSPRYLACPGGMALPFVLADIATLVSGGLGAVVSRRTRPRRRILATRAASLQGRSA